MQRAADRTWQPVDRDPACARASLPAGVSLAAIETAARVDGAAPVIVLSPPGSPSRSASRSPWATHRVRVSSDGVHAPVVEDLRRM